MDGLSRAIPVPGEVTLAGRTFVVRPRIIEHQATIEAEILRLKPNPLEVLADAEARFKDNPELLDKVIPQLLQMAISVDARCATPHDYASFGQSFRGYAFYFWLAVRDDEEDVTVEDIQKLVMKEVADLADKAQADGGLEMVQAANDAVQQVLLMMEREINKVTGEDPAGNSTGSPPTPSTKSRDDTPKTASEPESTGEKSSA